MPEARHDADPVADDLAADPFHLPELDPGEVEGVLADTEGPLLVDFFATWCGPCAWIVPTLRALNEAFGERVRIVKVDVDQVPDLARSLRIGSVPTIVLFEQGVEVERSIGVEPERVRRMVEEAAARAAGV